MKNKDKHSLNKLCVNCYNKCKQHDTVMLVKCPNYKYKPYQQELEFFQVRSARKKRTYIAGKGKK